MYVFVSVNWKIKALSKSEIPSLCRALPHRKFSAGFYLRLSVQCLVCRISFCGCLNPQFWNALHTFSIQSQIAFQINFIANSLCNKMLHYVGLWVIACSCDKIAGFRKVEILVSEQALLQLLKNLVSALCIGRVMLCYLLNVEISCVSLCRRAVY